MELKHDLLTTKHTRVYHEDEYKYNAPHHFVVGLADTPSDTITPIQEVHFQEGPIKECGECGVNGVCNEDLIAMVICRLGYFQRSEYACRDNAVAITKLEEALLWLRKRTIGRENRGVVGTSAK